MIPIESDGHVRHARRTAAWARVVIGLAGIALILAKPHLLERPALGLAGFATIVLTARWSLESTPTPVGPRSSARSHAMPSAST